jgi:hypothetical protein
LVAIVSLAFATGLSGCGQGGASGPGELLVTGTPRPFLTTGPELTAYARERRAALESLASEHPDEIVRGAITLARPLNPGVLHLMLTSAGITSDYYFEWIEPGTGVSGAAGRMQTADVLKDYPGLRVLYVNAEAPLASLRALAQDDRVWLVDVGGTENYYDLAHSAGLVP